MLSSSFPSLQYPLLDTTTTPRPLTPSRLPEAVWESATYICIMKSTFKAPTHPRTDFCIARVLVPGQTAGDNPVLQKTWPRLTYFSGLFWTATSISGKEKSLVSGEPWNQLRSDPFWEQLGPVRAQGSLGLVTEVGTCVGRRARRDLTEGGSMSSVPGF